MIAYGDRNLSRLNWFGAKALAARLLAFAPVNVAMRHALPHRIARRLPLNTPSVALRVTGASDLFLTNPLRDILARDIYWGRGAPTSAAERRKLACITMLARDARTFLDIGAYAGMCALVAARANPQLHAIAYEIVPENFLLAWRNVIENDLADRVSPRLLGLGASQGEVRMPRALGLPSLPTSISLASRFDTGVSVPISTLDAETAGSAGPFLLKIDVEGFEREVFAGGEGFIARARPDIICELLPDATGVAEIEALLAPFGYRFHAFAEDGVLPRQALRPEPDVLDWLLSARPDIGALVSHLNNL